MALRLRVGALSDIGLVRDGNEDALYAGPRLFAVADGVGGSAAGEVASHLTLTALIPLDDDTSVTDPLAALADAIRRATAALSAAIARDPRLEGMGTTLTAILWTDGGIGMAQVGDSRAYRWRDHELEQISRDQTLVQSLIDEGQITEDEAAVHPRRSWILRAIDGRDQVEPVLELLDVRAGDRYLLCSDGLSDYVSPEEIINRLTDPDPQAAVGRLVDAALAAGAPDNVSCIVIQVVDDSDDEPTSLSAPILGGSITSTPALLDEPVDPGVMPSEAAVADPVPAGRDRHRRQRGIGRRLAIVIGVVVVLLLAAVGATIGYIHHQWYVADDGGTVTIYQGVQGKALGIDLSHVHAHTNLPLSALSQDDRDRVNGGIDVSGLSAADTVVTNLRRDACQLLPTPTSTPTPTHTARRHKRKHHSASSTPPPPPWCDGVK